MKLGRAPAVERLAADEPCFGAVFCSYTFDPAFFEEQVLHAVLRLSSDPTENAPRFHDEARRALQATPVACVVDAGMRQPGHRLPYDLLEVSSRVFHPKTAILVYERFARFSVGSGNLTRGGYGDNTELFFVRDLDYAEPDHGALLWELHSYLTELASTLRAPGAQLRAATEALERRLPPRVAAPDKRDLVFIHSVTEPILDQFLALVPADARVARIGVLAPFFEKDDASTRDLESITSALTALATARPAKKEASLDLGLLWEDSPVACSVPEVPPLEENLDRIWAERLEDDGEPYVVFWVPTSLGPSTLSYTSSGGLSRREPREKVEKAISERRAWPIERPIAHAPRRIVDALGASGLHVQPWLHPASRFDGGRIVRRPLHAKLFLVCVERRRTQQTYVLLGSPNASRTALLLGRAENGNVETAVVFVLDGHVTLKDMCPELVWCPGDQLTLAEREYPEAPPNLALWVRSVVFDAAAGTLSIEWATSGPAPLGPWRIFYGGDEIAAGVDAPAGVSVIAGFVLHASSCELHLAAQGRDYAIPILVSDIASLPVSLELAGLELRELLALLGRRIGRERLATLRVQRGAASMDPVLEHIFGEGIGPTDVFKAWWGLAHDLAEEGLSLPAFRARLLGPLGLVTVWARLTEAAEAQLLSREEAWFYGAELLQTMRAVEVPAGPDAAAKRELMSGVVSDLTTAIASLRPESNEPWLGRILHHYGDHA